MTSAFVATGAFGVSVTISAIQQRRVRRSPQPGAATGGTFAALGFLARGLGAVIALGIIPAVVERARADQGNFAIVAALLGATGLLLMARAEFQHAIGRRRPHEPVPADDATPAAAFGESRGEARVHGIRLGGIDARAVQHAALAVWVVSVAWLGLGGENPSSLWIWGGMLGMDHLLAALGYVRFNRGGGIKLLQFAPVTGVFHVLWFVALGFWLR